MKHGSREFLYCQQHYVVAFEHTVENRSNGAEARWNPLSRKQCQTKELLTRLNRSVTMRKQLDSAIPSPIASCIQ